LGNAPEHGIDKAGESGEPKSTRKGHGRCHRRMGGRMKKQKTRCSQPQDVLHGKRGLPSEMGIQYGVQAAEPA